MYKNIPIIHEVQSLIHSEITQQFPLEIEKMENELKNSTQFGVLSLIPDQTIAVIKLIEKNENEEKIVDILSDKIEEYLALEREKKKKSSVLDRVTKANTLLIEANTIKSHESDKKGVLSQLANLEKEIEKLKTWAIEK